MTSPTTIFTNDTTSLLTSSMSSSPLSHAQKILSIDFDQLNASLDQPASPIPSSFLSSTISSSSASSRSPARPRKRKNRFTLVKRTQAKTKQSQPLDDLPSTSNSSSQPRQPLELNPNERPSPSRNNPQRIDHHFDENHKNSLNNNNNNLDDDDSDTDSDTDSDSSVDPQLKNPDFLKINHNVERSVLSVAYPPGQFDTLLVIRRDPKTVSRSPLPAQVLDDALKQRLYSYVVYYQVSSAHRRKKTLAFLHPDDLELLLAAFYERQLNAMYLTFLQVPFLVTTVAAKWAHARCIDPNFDTGLLMADAGPYLLLATYSAPTSGSQLMPKFLTIADRLNGRTII